MFSIPGWALGVAFIILASSVARAVFGGFSARGPRGRGGGWGGRREVVGTLDDMEQRLSAVEDAQRRLAELENLQTRLNEVEERLDFAERLLAKQRDGERLIPPKA